MDAMTIGLLEQEEVEALILAVAQGQETFTEDDVQQVMDWAHGVRIDYGLLQNVLSGMMSIRWNEEDGEPNFSLTPAGIAHVESMGATTSPATGAEGGEDGDE